MLAWLGGRRKLLKEQAARRKFGLHTSPSTINKATEGVDKRLLHTQHKGTDRASDVHKEEQRRSKLSVDPLLLQPTNVSKSLDLLAITMRSNNTGNGGAAMSINVEDEDEDEGEGGRQDNAELSSK